MLTWLNPPPRRRNMLGIVRRVIVGVESTELAKDLLPKHAPKEGKVGAGQYQ